MTTKLEAELAERIAAKQVVVVVGTGVSLAATGNEKLASWKGLIASGLDRIVELGLCDTKWAEIQKDLLEGDLSDLLGVAHQVSDRLHWMPTEPCGGDWNDWLHKTVGRLHVKHPELIEAIRDLGTPIATLNYDDLLSEVTRRFPLTWQDSERWPPVIAGQDEAILHLHGHWRRPSSVVLGIGAYNKVLGEVLAQHLQRALASLQSLAFVGCSSTLEDPNFGPLLAWMRAHLGGTAHSHYVFLREGEPLPLPEPQLREARIVPLRYGKMHTALLPFIRKLAKLASQVDQPLQRVVPETKPVEQHRQLVPETKPVEQHRQPASEFSSWVSEPRSQYVELINKLWQGFGGKTQEILIKYNGESYAVIRVAKAWTTSDIDVIGGFNLDRLPKESQIGIMIEESLLDDAVNGPDTDAQQQVAGKLKQLNPRKPHHYTGGWGTLPGD